MSEPKLWPVRRGAGRVVVLETDGGRGCAWALVYHPVWPPLPGFVFSMLMFKEKAVAWIRGSTIRSPCVHAYGNNTRTLLCPSWALFR